MTMRRTMLLPLLPLYAAALRWKRWMFATGRLKSRRLEDAVISVGSVSAGGAGKTPVVLLLSSLLEQRGYAVRILTRGYGRAGTRPERVNPEGDPRWFGDEPLLLAQRTGVPVYVGADRYEAGLLAGEAPGLKKAVYLLDDGFQHRQLARDLDLVLLTRRDLEDVLLPAGDLREPLSALREADVVMVREDEAESMRGFLSALRGEGGRPRIWEIRRRLQWTTTGGVRVPKRPVVFCGIARPEGFLGMLEAEGVRAAATVFFRDHHRYEDRDIARLLEQARRGEADGFMTTEKDAVKLTEAMRSGLERVGRLVVPELQMELVDEKGALEQMMAMVPKLDRRRTR